MNLYRIIGGDGKEYGPISSDQLRQWLVENRANAQTRVRLEGEADWKPLGTVPEFADALAQKTVLPQAAPAFAAPASVAELISADYNLDIGECLSRSWDTLRGNFGTVVGGCAIYMLIQMGLAGVGNIPIIGMVISVVNYVFVAGPMLAGLYYFLLKGIRRQPAEIGDIFSGFRTNYWQSVLTYVVMMLIMVVAALPGGAALGFAIFEMARQHAVDATHLVIAAIGGVVAMVPAVYLSVSWIFSLVLVLDRGMGFWDAMELSRKMVGKHWWTVFGLLVVCGLVQIVGLCACCVGLVVSTPVGFGAMMCAYERIFTTNPAPAS